MKKIIITLLSTFFAITCYAMPLTDQENGVTGELSVKYNGEQAPAVLLEGQNMNLTVKINQNSEYFAPKMFVGLFEDNRLKKVQISEPNYLDDEIKFETIIQLDDDLSDKFIKILLWDNNQKPISKSMLLVDTLRAVDYEYDTNNRLLSVAYSNKIIIYNYSDNGNLIGKTIQTNSIQPTLFKLPKLLFEDNLQNDEFKTDDQSDETQEQIENFLSINPDILAALVSVEVIDGVTVTTYDLSLMENLPLPNRPAAEDE